MENYLKNEVAKLGGVALKFHSPYSAGYPDRICLLPRGVSFWVELKSPTGKATRLQLERIRELATMGHPAFICHTREEIDEIIKLYRK